MSVYNLENIFSEGYVDSAALRLLLESLIEDQQTSNNNSVFKTKKITKISEDGKFIEKYNLYENMIEEQQFSVNVNNKTVDCITLLNEESYIQNIKNVECSYTIYETFEGEIVKEVTRGKLNGSEIRGNSSIIAINRSTFYNLKDKAANALIVFYLTYQVTEDKEKVEVINDETDYTKIENLLFSSNI